MIINDIEENSHIDETELTQEQKRTLELAKRIMTKYVGDHFSDRISKEEFASLLEQINIGFCETDPRT